MVASNLEAKVNNANGSNCHSSWFGRLKKSVATGLGKVLYGSNGYSKEAEEEIERQKFADSIRVKYKLSDDKLTKVLDVVEREYARASGLKTREEVLMEEEKLTRGYKEFFNHMQLNPNNFIARSIVEKVQDLYFSCGKSKSLGRIFAELKAGKYFHVEMGYNPEENRYEVRVDGQAKDIRDLKIRTSQRDMHFVKYGVNYDDYLHGRIDEEDKHEIKRNIIHGLDYYTGRYGRELAAFGINVFYHGVDSVLEERYQLSNASHNIPARKHSYPASRNGHGVRARALELVGSA
jgi:hypothetical protein